ncbi:MAG TPA: TlyA family rRNA (cytidine-2'-O)-methyltransferase [Gaiellaceae bacterium]|nr:TlyA family rRNA (cytidine-2'-O)-methyltransferase [Gaiellaceae bacterium]
MKRKKRLDVILVERGLAESRAQAQALVLAGLVPGYEKPGQQVDEAVEVEVKSPPPYVSRGGEKLAHGLDGLGVDPKGLDCVDVGASTGGFTDVLLRRGATRVVALDVGYGQLHPRLRGDPRVVVLERTNARSLTELPFAPQLVTCDVSFISVRVALPAVLRLAAHGWQALVLVKPQFEAGRADVGKGGVVRDPAGRDCLDVGASTGGFTDVLLQRGATRVIALDVGYGQLHPRLRADERVTVLERTNAREVESLPFAPELVVCDVSFISVRKALPAVLELARPGWEAVVLVKPQFEAGRGEVGKGGVVTSDETRARVVREVAEAAVGWDAATAGVVDSGLPGPKGNRELFIHLVHRHGAGLPDELDRWIADAVG